MTYADLDELALKYGTDKSSADHHYTPHYERYLEPQRYWSITLLELGIWQGASLRMWREYLPYATIVGLDNVDRGVRIPNVNYAIAEQDDHEDIEFCLGPYGEFNVIIDDASHISSKTIASFRLLWPKLAPGGLYVIEDLQTSYDEANYGKTEACANPNHAQHLEMYTAMRFCERLADEVNRSLFPTEHWLGFDVASVQFFPNICFITKGQS